MGPLLLLLIILFTALSCRAYKDSNPYPWGSNPNNRFRMYWKDASNVIQDLDQFQALYIKVHGCVWSECAVDQYDDDGENRDGDENWYQYRTQEFCANAAYSLYGIKKGHFRVVNTCSRATYINSFFTYGGADVLADAVGLNVDRYYDDGYTDDDAVPTNAYCFVVDNDENGNDDAYSGMSSTMGCTPQGKFAMANFQGQTCDGNYFLETTDSLNAYNRQVNGVSCHKVWALSSASSSSSTAETLLRSSWACDLDMYPQTCPDPYGLKTKYTAISRAATNHKPVALARINSKLKRPLRIISWLSMLLGIAFVCIAFYVKNRQDIAREGGGFKGFVALLKSDITRAMSKHARRRKRAKKKVRKKQNDDQESPPREKGVFT